MRLTDCENETVTDEGKTIMEENQPGKIPAPPETIIEKVAWAVHCWTCPLCTSMDAMAQSGTGHVTEDDLRFATFLKGALGLEEAS